jgi:uncharacterized protein
MKALIALLLGVLFGLGLALSQMTNPDKVLGFLDWFGDWDPTLLFVMLGALSITLPGYFFVFKRSKPILETSFTLPAKTKLDSPLIIGAILFGIGWGLSGYCPGPGLANIAINSKEAFIFCSTLLVGFYLAKKYA